MPASVLMPDSFPPVTMEAVSEQWSVWRQEASDRKVVAPDLENELRRHQASVQAEKTTEAVVDHHRYLAARTVQKLECRVRARAYEQECVEATELTTEFSDARAEALRATLDLERSLQDDLRRELDQFRAEAETRQDELYNALRQMEGKFASIRRDARGTIVSLADILFDFDKATLRREVEFNLVKIATILNQFGEMKILIEGHTDSIGSDEYNLGLSQKRAKAVYDFMVSQGVDENRMSWKATARRAPSRTTAPTRAGSGIDAWTSSSRMRPDQTVKTRFKRRGRDGRPVLNRLMPVFRIASRCTFCKRSRLSIEVCERTRGAHPVVPQISSNS